MLCNVLTYHDCILDLLSDVAHRDRVQYSSSDLFSSHRKISQIFSSLRCRDPSRRPLSYQYKVSKKQVSLLFRSFAATLPGCVIIYASYVVGYCYAHPSTALSTIIAVDVPSWDGIECRGRVEMDGSVVVFFLRCSCTIKKKWSNVFSIDHRQYQ